MLCHNDKKRSVQYNDTNGESDSERDREREREIVRSQAWTGTCHFIFCYRWEYMLTNLHIFEPLFIGVTFIVSGKQSN